jgi:hypothetical protein
MDKPDIMPKFIAGLIDISEHCEPEFLERCGGKVYYSGFFDDSTNHHLCSFQKNIWFEVVELVPEKYPEGQDEAEALHSELLDARTLDDDDYFPRDMIERLMKEHPDHFEELKFNFDEDEEKTEEELDRERHEEVREYLSGNPYF